MTSKPKHERYGGSKARTGCATCKERRVKCDAAKPTCARCTKAGRLCGWYAPPPPKNRIAAGQPLVIISYVAPESSISLLPEVGYREKRSLEFFQTYTVQETFPSADWPENLLRTSFFEDSVRNAVVALGALHEYYTGMGQMDPDFAMQQYSKAMKQIMKLDMRSSTSTDVALISCILFACCESLQDHYRSSLLHINSGIQILNEQEASGVEHTKVAYINKEILRPLFLRFVTQSREIGDDAILLTYDALPTTAQTTTTTLNSFEEAHSSMTIYLHEFILFLNNLESSILRGIYDLTGYHQQA